MNEDFFHLGIKAVIRNKKGELLLLHVNKKELIDEPLDYWDIPGGRIKRGQKVEEALAEEVFDETGIKEIGAIEHLAMIRSNIRIPKQIGDSDVGLILSIYVCEVQNPKKIMLSKEHIGYEWFSPQQAAKLLSYKYPKEFTDKISKL